MQKSEDEVLGKKAKKVLESFVGEVDKKLSKYWEEELSKDFGQGQKQKGLIKRILDHASEHNLRSSKRLRGSLVYWGYKLRVGSEDTAGDIWKAVEAVELIHTALLMHDDFMDKDKFRRGKPTTQEYFADGDKHFGDAMAVSVGDSVLCLGFERFLDCGMEVKKVMLALKQLIRGVTNTAFGQAFDVSLGKTKDFSEEEVLGLHYLKTAVYTYQNPLLSGAILAGIDDEVINILKNYSDYAGVAFQIQDDILGLFGDEEKTGKSSDSDLLQGKVTLLITEAMKNEEAKEKIMKVWGKEDSAEEDIKNAKEIMKTCGAYDYSVNKAKVLAEKAVEESRKLRLLKVNQEAVDYLEGIAQYMVAREV